MPSHGYLFPRRPQLSGPPQILLDENAHAPFLHEVAQCAGKVLAYSGGGKIVFIGRSLDSVADLLGAALIEAGVDLPLERLSLSFRLDGRRKEDGTWTYERLGDERTRLVREMLTHVGLAPREVIARREVTCLVDVVSSGGTFGFLYDLLHDWADETGVPWRDLRTKLRFVGVTIREETSPKTWRWWQDPRHAWVKTLPARNVKSISIPWWTWDYLGNSQVKLTRQHSPRYWMEGPRPVRRDDRLARALAEAQLVTQYGRSQEGRSVLRKAFRSHPALRETWLRKVDSALR